MLSIIKIFIPVVAAVLLSVSNYAKADDFEIIKSRIVTELLKTPIDDQSVEAILGRMVTEGSFQDINYEDLSRTAGFPHRRHTGDLVYLAKAYKNPNSKFHRSRPLKEKIINSL